MLEVSWKEKFATEQSPAEEAGAMHELNPLRHSRYPIDIHPPYPSHLLYSQTLREYERVLLKSQGDNTATTLLPHGVSISANATPHFFPSSESCHDGRVQSHHFSWYQTGLEADLGLIYAHALIVTACLHSWSTNTKVNQGTKSRLTRPWPAAWCWYFFHSEKGIKMIPILEAHGHANLGVRGLVHGVKSSIMIKREIERDADRQADSCVIVQVA
jgi:hypothetical protein